MIIKYRIHALAKDLNMTSKQIIDFLTEKNIEVPKKHMTILTDNQLNMILDHFTSQNQKQDLLNYLKEKAQTQNDSQQDSAEKEPAKSQDAVQVDKNKINKEDSEKLNNNKNNQVNNNTETNNNTQSPNKNTNNPQNRPANNQSRPNNNYNRPNNSQNNQNRPNNNYNRPNNNQNNQDRPNSNYNRPNNNQNNQDRPNNNYNRPNNNQNNQDRPNNNYNRSNNNQNNQNRPNNNYNRPNNAPIANKPEVKVPNNNVSQPAQTTAPVQNKNAKPTTTTMHIDTRAAQVDLDKYNEKYDKMAASKTTIKDTERKKQKISQKSTQRARNQRSNKNKETEAQKLNRIALEKARRQQLKVNIPDEITVGELATRLKATAASVIKKLMALGIMASVTEVIDFDTASLVAIEMGAKVEREVVVTIEDRLFDETEDSDDNTVERPPVVVVMGHVDHGKTSLLDYIRNAQVTSTEAGGITQHIGAYMVKVKDKYMSFLDTPGHAAFTSMRARGAQVTDIAILVVAADDGIMPQTIEAINHAKAAEVSIIVAINKMDKPDANPDRIKQELTEHGLVVEEWGGDIIAVPISAKTGEGIDTLLEMVQLTAEVKELKANPDRLAKGTVIEARLDKGRGPVATILVQNGTLRVGDVIIAGTAVGHVRTMLDDRGNILETAGPSVPVEITGLGDVPSAGDIFNAVEDEKLARELTERRIHAEKQRQFNQHKIITLDNLFSQIAEGEVKELSIIVKADVQGSVEAVKQSLEKLTNEEVRVRVIHGGVGAISESDVMLANASNAIIIGFNVRPDSIAENSAEISGVDMRMYRIIYDAIDDVKLAMRGMLTPKYRDVTIGHIEVRTTYKISSVGTIAGCYVLDGKIERSSQIRVVRDGIVIIEDEIKSLKRFKDDAKEVRAGFECGIGLNKFNDIKEGDILEAFYMQEYIDEDKIK